MGIMERYSKVGMQELDQRLSKIVEAARKKPVSVYSEQQLYEQLNYNLLFCWFIGLDLNKVWSFNVLSRDIATLLNNPRAVQLIQKIIGEVFCGALLQMPEFSLNFALLHTWLGKHAATSTTSN